MIQFDRGGGVFMKFSHVLWLLVIGLTLPAWTPVLAVDQDHDGIQDSEEDFLLNKHAPVVFLHPSEDRWPANVDWFLDHSRFRFHHGGGCDDCQILDRPDQQQLVSYWHNKKHSWFHIPPCSHYNNREYSDRDYDSRNAFFVQVLDDDDHHGPSDPSEWTVYGHAYLNKWNGINLQYWFFYPYNEGPVGFNHEGDWENIIVQLNPDGSIRDAVYYGHGDGRPIAKHNVTWYQQDHPVVMSALGSHASYENFDSCNDRFFGFGERGCVWYTPPENAATAWFTWQGGRPAGAPGYQGAGVVNVGEKVTGGFDYLNGQRFIHFSGHWGEIGIPRLPENFCWGPLCRGHFSGPRGPAYQSAWKKGRAPQPHHESVWVDDDFDSSTPGWGDDRFDSINTAIVRVVDGGSVYVAAGTYYEKFEINKPVRLLGDGYEVTSIDGQGQTGSPVIRVNSSDVLVRGFTIENGSAGVEIYQSSECTLTRNRIRNFTWGVVMAWDTASDNTIYQNVFENNNYFHVSSITGGVNEYSYGTPPAGNYYDDYTGPDHDGDGIGDTPYAINATGEVDNHPMMQPDSWRFLMDPNASSLWAVGGRLEVQIVNGDGESIAGFPSSRIALEARVTDPPTSVLASFTSLDSVSDGQGTLRFEMSLDVAFPGPIEVEARLLPDETIGTTEVNVVDGSCEFRCGERSGTCYCDEACETWDDCCADYVVFDPQPEQFGGCRPAPVCGDGVCDGFSGLETPTNCCADCGTCAVCGNGICESGETSGSCPQDCGTGGSCRKYCPTEA